jgi:hypothetical protein
VGKVDFDCEEIAIAEYLCSNVCGVIRTMRSTVKNILRWFAGIGAIFKRSTEHSLQRTRPASDIAAETRTESAAKEGGAVASTTESAVATPTAATTLIAVAKADARSAKMPGSAESSPFHLTRRRSSADANWSGSCSTISGADATTSRRVRGSAERGRNLSQRAIDRLRRVLAARSQYTENAGLAAAIEFTQRR